MKYVITGGTRIIVDHLSRVHQLFKVILIKDAKRKRAYDNIQASIARMK